MVLEFEGAESPEDIVQAIASFGKDTVVRVINNSFVQEAIETGTDKAHVVQHDFRKVTSGSGYDVWGVEKKAKDMGLSPNDVFCGEESQFFCKELLQKGEYTTVGLGIPTDRSAILIYKSDALEAIPKTDGFYFRNTSKKKEALLGVVNFREKQQSFEEELEQSGDIVQQIQILKQIIFSLSSETRHLIPYIGVRLIRLQYCVSLEQSLGTNADTTKLKQLRLLSERLDYEEAMIEAYENYAGQVQIAMDKLSQNIRPNIFRSWFDFVINEIKGDGLPGQPDEKYEPLFKKVVTDAIAAKKKFSID